MAKIDDVARLAGVSKGTVSNVFSQKRPTSKKVTERVLRASRELNYVPNQIARSLATKKTMTIGLTLPHGHFFLSSFHNQFINGVILEASTLGYRVLLDTIPEQVVETPFLASYPIDGAIVMGPTEEDSRIKLLHKSQIPYVTVGKIFNKGVDAPTVNNDNYRIMHDICNYLISMGHKNMMFLNAGEKMTVSYERKESFIRTLSEHGIELQDHMIHYKSDIQSSEYLNYGYKETIQVLNEQGKQVTAIIADDDRTAFSVLNAIQELGLSVPEDISLFVICGDLSIMHQSTPSLTGMDLQPSELGVEAVRMLMRRLGVLEGDYSASVIVESRIIERNSCSSPRGRKA